MIGSDSCSSWSWHRRTQVIMSTLNRLRTFVVVAKHLNLRKAAQELRISQPSVSQQLKVLEEYFGVPLHTKSGRGIELTEKGRLFLEDAEVILSQFKRLEEKFRNRFPAADASSLTVGGTYGPSAILLPSVIMKFKKKYPKINVNLVTASQRALERKLYRGELEIAVVSSVEPPSHFHSQPFGTMESVAFVAVDHPLAKKKELSLPDLAKTPLIIRGGRGAAKSITEIILKQLSDLGFKVNIAMRSDSSEAVKAAVRKKAGVGILYRDVLKASLRRGEFKLINLAGINMKGNLFIIYPQARSLSANARAFLALLHQWQRIHSNQ